MYFFFPNLIYVLKIYRKNSTIFLENINFFEIFAHCMCHHFLSSLVKFDKKEKLHVLFYSTINYLKHSKIYVTKRLPSIYNN